MILGRYAGSSKKFTLGMFLRFKALVLLIVTVVYYESFTLISPIFGERL